MSGTDHYEVLNVERKATTDEIKSAYRRLVRQVHPDQGGNAALFRLVQEAWTTLSDPHKRAAYDRDLSGQSTAGPESAYDEQPEAEEDTGPDEPWVEAAPDRSTRVIRVVPRFGRWRGVALSALTIWLILAVGPYVYSALHEGWSVPIGLLLAALTIIGLPPHWRHLAVGHLVIAGDRLAVVSSVIGPAGTYTLDLYGSVLRNGQPFDDPALGAAVTAWQARLKKFAVRGFVIIHPAVEGHGQITVKAGSDAAVTCLPARSAADELSGWLRPEGDVLNRSLLYDVLYQAPLDLR